MYKVVMCAQKARIDMYRGLSLVEANGICEYYGWQVALDGNGSFVWSLDIEEDF